MYLSGKSRVGVDLKLVQLNKLHVELMEYADALEQTQPSLLRTLKAQLHEREVALNMKALEDKAHDVHKGVGATCSEALAIEAGLTVLLARAKLHSNNMVEKGTVMQRI